MQMLLGPARSQHPNEDPWRVYVMLASTSTQLPMIAGLSAPSETWTLYTDQPAELNGWHQYAC